MTRRISYIEKRARQRREDVIKALQGTIVDCLDEGLPVERVREIFEKVLECDRTGKRLPVDEIFTMNITPEAALDYLAAAIRQREEERE